MLSYTTSDASYAGELVAMDSALTTVKSRAPVNGFYAGVALPSTEASQTGARLAFTALSPVMTAAAATSASGLYVLDACDGGTLLKGGCGTSFKLDTWGGSSGPVAVDGAGTLFAALSAAGSGQEVRGFTATQARGAQAVVGTKVLGNNDFSSSIAAVAPTAGSPGLVVVQTNDGATFASKAALVFSYTAGATVTADGAPVRGLPGHQGGREPRRVRRPRRHRLGGDRCRRRRLFRRAASQVIAAPTVGVV